MSGHIGETGGDIDFKVALAGLHQKVVEEDEDEVPDQPPQELSTDSASYLPDEILALIFEVGQRDIHFLPRGRGEWLGGQTPKPRRVEIMVSHVSRRWRFVALNSPFLWTKIVASLGQPNLFLQLYLKRSKRLVIDLLLECLHRSIHEIEFVSNWTRSVQAILPHMHRCRCINIQAFRDVSAFSILKCFSESPLPALEAVSISLAEGSAYHSHSDIIKDDKILKGSIPKLSCLALSGIYMAVCCLSSTTIATLYLDVPILDEAVPTWDHEGFRGFIATFPALLHLTIAMNVIELHPMHHRIEIASLRSLDIMDIDARRLLSVLHLPLLETLKIRGSFVKGWVELENTRPLPNLHTLSLDFMGFNDPSVYLNIFHQLPGATTLNLAGDLSILGALRALLHPDSIGYCPCLNAIHVSGFTAATLIRPLLAAVVESRAVAQWSLDFT